MLNQEPAAVSGAVAELIRQGMFLLLAFEVVRWTDTQQAMVLSFTSAALAVGVVLFSRFNTVSHARANKQIQIALDQQPSTTSVQEVVDMAKEGD